MLVEFVLNQRRYSPLDRRYLRKEEEIDAHQEGQRLCQSEVSQIMSSACDRDTVSDYIVGLS